MVDGISSESEVLHGLEDISGTDMFVSSGNLKGSIAMNHGH